jgi:hypothetical protein
VILTALEGGPVGIIQTEKDGNIHAYDMIKGCLLREIHAGTPLPSVIGANIIKDTPIIISICSDFFIRAWDLSTGKLLSESPTQYDCCINPIVVGEVGGHNIVVAFELGDDGGMIRIWRLSDWYELLAISLPFNNDAISIQDPFVCVGSEKGILCLCVNPSL